MSYTQQEIDRLIQLKDEIEGRKEHAYAAPTYLDSPALAEMSAIVAGNTEESEDVLEDKITVLDYLTDCYDDMGRTGISVKLYGQLLEAYAQLAQKRELFEEEKENLKNTFYCAVLARNRYIKDDCEDLVQFVSQLIGDEKVKHCKKAVTERIRILPKLDPVELTDANRERYERFVSDRIMPGAEQAVSDGDCPGLSEIIGTGMVSDADLRRLLERSLRSGRIPVTSLLMSEIRRRSLKNR